ncbi:MAG: hypothetical protein ACRBBW_03640 [Cellvibrionaceae bacterium]
MELSSGVSRFKFQVDHARFNSRRLLTPFTTQTTNRPNLSAMIAPKDLLPPAKEPSPIPTAIPASPLETSARFRIMIAMVEYLSGKSLSGYRQDFSAITNQGTYQFQPAKAKVNLSTATSEASSPQKNNSNTSENLDNLYQVEITNAERLAFSLVSDVTTSDGLTHSVQLMETHQRQHKQTLSVSASEAAKFIDPLVLNLEGSLQFGRGTTAFDLDSDGSEEQFRQLGQGSFFLALDLNGDGIVNNGKELFGTQSGNGFSDLRLYDEDGNGLIDKGDSIFEALRLFRTDTQELTRLSEKQIIAIGLTAIETPFTFTDSEGTPLAQLRQSSFYLRENGQHGTIQHIDLAV